MQNTLKILLTLTLSLLLVLSFAACGDKDDNSSNGSSIDPTQDYADEWGEMDAPTESEKQEIEDLWNDGISSDSGKIEDTTDKNEDTTTSGGTSSDSSSDTSSSTNSDEEGTASEGELKGEVGKVENGIF